MRKTTQWRVLLRSLLRKDEVRGKTQEYAIELGVAWGKKIRIFKEGDER